MSRTIDIRLTVTEAPITKIRFADENRMSGGTFTTNRQADVIVKGDNCIKITESGNNDYVRLWSVDHARDLIKAIEKSIDLGMIK